MNKRPSLQFYPADWLKDPDLQMCSMGTIGVWINLLCRMWEAKEEGILQGKSGELALLVGARPGEFKRFLKEAESHNFCDVLHDVTNCHSIVTIKCRRMNKLFLEREGAKQRMQKHREKHRDGDVTLYSSSSSSSSNNNEFITYWNSKENLPQIRGFSEKRKKKLEARLGEQLFAENWKPIIDNLTTSPFHTGQNDRGWRATVDWLLENDTNYLKIYELEVKPTIPKTPKLCFVDKEPATVEVKRYGKVKYICDVCLAALRVAPMKKARDGKTIPNRYKSYGELEIMILEQKANGNR